MNFSKKILLGGALLTSLATTSLVFVSCGSTASDPFELGISPDVEKYYGEQLAKQVTAKPTEAKRKTMLITAGGSVNDKSFNQSAWGALEIYKKQAQMSGSDVTFRETLNNPQLSTAYDQALNGGYQNWVLTGFQQEEQFALWLAKGNNRAEFMRVKPTIIGVDWDNKDDKTGEAIVPAGYFFGLQFKTNEAAWVVGQAASAYLTSTGKKPHLSSFGGANFDGVTDFNNGFLQGMLDWNTTNATKKVKFYSGNNQVNNINLGTGFNIDEPGIKDTITKIVGTNDNAPQIILPVAGSLTVGTIDDIKGKNSKQMVIGVDSNQAISFPQDKTRFFSSIEKRVAVAVYKTLMLLSGVKLDYAADAGFEGKFVAGTTSESVKYGFDKGFVGYSSSTLAGEDATTVNRLLKEAYDKFKEGTGGSKPTIVFQPMTDSSKNQGILDGIIVQINKP